MLVDLRRRSRGKAGSNASPALVALLSAGLLLVGCLAETSEHDELALEWLEAPQDGDLVEALRDDDVAPASPTAQAAQPSEAEQDPRLDFAMMLRARLRASEHTGDAGASSSLDDEELTTEAELALDSSLELARELLEQEPPRADSAADGGASLRDSAP